MTDLSRRRMLTGAALAAAATAVSTPKAADAASPEVEQDLKTFVTLSAALTGIDESRIAPAVDPVQIKRQYYNEASDQPGFEKLMNIMRGNASNPALAAEKVMHNPDPVVKYLGRSIILAWYTGCWYDPKTLRRFNSPDAPKGFVEPAKVISGTAYTQGWNWRVAQTHPMGYSEWRFGYWSEEPPSLGKFIGKF